MSEQTVKEEKEEKTSVSIKEDGVKIKKKQKKGKKSDKPTDNKRVPLKIDTKCIASDETLLAQIETNAKRGLPEFLPLPPAHNGTIVLCGSGPSILHELENIREHKRKGQLVVAIKGCHDLLIQNGIKPDWCIMLDPQEKILNCVTKNQDGIIYMLASQCHPKVFDELQKEKRYVVIWHALSNIGEEKLLENRALIGGGTTTGLRALNMVYTMGYRKVHLYGYDSNVIEHEGKTYKRVNVHTEGGLDQPGKIIDVWVGGNRFWANPAMAAQANEFQQAMAVLKGLKVNVHGDSLIREIWKHHIGMGGDCHFED